jgi:hypothetical protein
VKLAAMFCVALLSVGCATDDEITGGGFLAGLRPAKPSADDPGTAVGAVPDVSGNGLQKIGMWQQDPLLHGSDLHAETILDGHAPLPNEVCGGCEVTLITVGGTSADSGRIGEIEVVDDGGDHICTIVVSADGTQDTYDCVR